MKGTSISLPENVKAMAESTITHSAAIPASLPMSHQS